MKKVLTGIVIVAVVLLVAFLIAGLLGPQGFKMERSVEIKAPRALVYRNISDYHNWMKWSPWAKIDSNCKYDYYGTQGQVGAGYKWKGNDRVGEGDIHTTDMAENNSLTSQLSFIKPFSSQAIATFTFGDGDNGSTKVTWGFSQSYSFSQRPFMLFMNLEKMLGADYEHGLANLKDACEKETAAGPVSNLEVKEVSWTGKTYLAHRSTADMKDLGKLFQEYMPKTFMYAKQNKFQLLEPPTGLYYTWDTAAGKTDVAIAVPVKDASKASGDYTAITILASKALAVDYYGPYEKIGPAHDAIHKYASDKGLKLKSPAIEEYISDPGVEKDPNKVLTRVYYLIEG